MNHHSDITVTESQSHDSRVRINCAAPPLLTITGTRQQCLISGHQREHPDDILVIGKKGKRRLVNIVICALQSNGGGGIIAASKELLAEAANASRSADASTRRTSQ